MNLDTLWREISAARSDRRQVTEFRMCEETRRDLVRAVEARTAVGHEPGLTTAFGIPVVVDPSVPRGMIVPVFDVEPWPHPIWEPMGPSTDARQLRAENAAPVVSPDESHGMTIDELLGDIDQVLAEHGESDG